MARGKLRMRIAVRAVTRSGQQRIVRLCVRVVVAVKVLLLCHGIVLCMHGRLRGGVRCAACRIVRPCILIMATRIAVATRVALLRGFVHRRLCGGVCCVHRCFVACQVRMVAVHVQVYVYVYVRIYRGFVRRMLSRERRVRGGILVISMMELDVMGCVVMVAEVFVGREGVVMVVLVVCKVIELVVMVALCCFLLEVEVVVLQV